MPNTMTLNDAVEYLTPIKESASLENYHDALELAIACMKEHKGAADRLYEKAIYVFGEDPQIDMMIEEMSELTKALLKYRRWKRFGGNSRTSGEYVEAIAEEIADVDIVLTQMMKLFRCSGSVSKYKAAKLDRLANRIDAEIVRKTAKQGASDSHEH